MRKLSETFGLEAVVPFLLGDTSPIAQHYAAQWIYSNYAAIAYSGFLKYGRGVLVGPLAKADDGGVLDSAMLHEAVFETGDWAISAFYYAAAQQDFGMAIPEAKVRSILVPVLNTYDPELEVPILLMRDGQPHALFPEFHNDGASPRDLYNTMNHVGSVANPYFSEPFPAARQGKAQRPSPAFVTLAAT